MWSEPQNSWWWNKTLGSICRGSAMFISNAYHLCCQSCCHYAVCGEGKLICEEELFPVSEAISVRPLCFMSPLLPQALLSPSVKISLYSCHRLVGKFNEKPRIKVFWKLQSTEHVEKVITSVLDKELQCQAKGSPQCYPSHCPFAPD